MKNLTLEHLADACGGRYTGPDDKKNLCVTDITTDSRKTTEGCLFVPIRGARADGHDYIGQVIEKGAAAVLSEKELGDTGFPYICLLYTSLYAQEMKPDCFFGSEEIEKWYPDKDFHTMYIAEIVKAYQKN